MHQVSFRTFLQSHSGLSQEPKLSFCVLQYFTMHKAVPNVPRELLDRGGFGDRRSRMSLPQQNSLGLKVFHS